MDIIDIHAHPIPPRFRSMCEGVGVFGGIGEPLLPWEEDEVLALMDATGVRVQVLSYIPVGFSLPDLAFWKALCRTANEELAEIVARHPDRFAGLAMLPVGDDEACLEELEYALDALALDGVSLMSNVQGVYVGDPRTEPLFAELSRRQTLVHLHPNDVADSNGRRPNWFPYLVDLPFETTRAVANLVLSGTLHRHPDSNIVLSHAGGAVPFLAARLETASFSVPRLRERLPNGVIHELRRLHYDIAMSTSRFVLPSLRELVPVERILIGTDFPYVPAQALGLSLDALEKESEWTEEELRLVRHGNAERLLPRLKR